MREGTLGGPPTRFTAIDALGETGLLPWNISRMTYHVKAWKTLDGRHSLSRRHADSNSRLFWVALVDRLPLQRTGPDPCCHAQESRSPSHATESSLGCSLITFAMEIRSWRSWVLPRRPVRAPGSRYVRSAGPVAGRRPRGHMC